MRVPLLLALLSPNIALAATYTVDPYGGGDFSSISAAIGAASPGDTLYLSAGIHPVGTEIDKELYFVGASAAFTAITGTGNGVIVSAPAHLVDLAFDAANGPLFVQGTDVEFQGVRVVNGTGPANGALQLEYSSITLNECGFKDNQGGHLYAVGSILEVQQSWFKDGHGDTGTISLFESDWSSSENLFSGNLARVGGALFAENSVLFFTDEHFEHNEAEEAGGAVAIASSLLDDVGGTYLENVAGTYGGAIATTGDQTSIFLVDTTLEWNEAGDDGGGLAVTGTQSTVDLKSSKIASNLATWNGGGLVVHDPQAIVTIESSSLTSNVAYRGGGAYVRAELFIDDSAFDQNTARFGGGLRWNPSSALAAFRSEKSMFSNNHGADVGGAVSAIGGASVTLADNDFLQNQSSLGSAVDLTNVPVHSAKANRFCSNTGTSSAVTISAAANLDALGEWTRNLFWGNSGALFQLGTHSLIIENNLFTHDHGLEVMKVQSESVIQNNVFLGNQGSALQSVHPYSFVGYNLFYENSGGDSNVPSTTHLFVSPKLIADDSCDADFRPHWGSPVIDAGAPTTFDPDASIADIGLFGGGDSPPSLWIDGDQDGLPAVYDCDDSNSLIRPGFIDTPYDGVDQDCSGSDLCDVDADGQTAPECGGLDCDDSNPDAYLGAAEIWYDAVDQDCLGGSDIDQDGDGVAAIDAGGTDCNDLDPYISPEKAEIWYDGVDQNCDGNDADQDGDGFEGGWGDDCDDLDASVYPGAEDDPYDGIDQDCSYGDSNDQDGDGYDAVDAGGHDCNDSDNTVHPDAYEVWYDGIDQDCDGNDTDQDGDGFDYTEDCDDLLDVVFPGAMDATGDGVDADCDGTDGADIVDGLGSVKDGHTFGCNSISGSAAPPWLFGFAALGIRILAARRNRRANLPPGANEGS